MNKHVKILLLLLMICGVERGAYAQRTMSGMQTPPNEQSSVSKSVRTASGVTSTLVGPVFPPPLGVFFNQSGFPNDGSISRAGGKNYYFSGANLANSTTVYWGATGTDIRLSLDGGVFTTAESLLYAPGFSSFAGGVVGWTGGSQYYNKLGVGPFLISTRFIMTVTDSASGSPIALTSAGSVGLPANVAAVVPVTASLHFKVNLEFDVFFSGVWTPALDFFDVNADGLTGPCFSSFDAGFYYTNVPPTISDITDTSTTVNVSVGPIPFTIGDVETNANSLVLSGYSSNTTVIDNTGIHFTGSGSSRNITLTPQLNQTGTTTIKVTVSDGLDSTSDTFNVTVNGYDVTIKKFSDTDGDPNTSGDQAAKQWFLSLYQGTISPINLVGSGNTSQLVVTNLTPGTYIATEADSGSSWLRINGNHMLYDTLTVASLHTIDTFVNFRTNTIVVRKYQDNDDDIETSGDRVLKTWHVEIHKDTTGPLVDQSDLGIDSIGGLGDGTYTASESDSSGWINLGYEINGTPVTTTDHSVTFIVAGGQTTYINFVNAPPIYNQSFRSFSEDSLANDKDNKGKVGKFVKPKADKVKVKLRFQSPAIATGFELKFSMNFTGTLYSDTTKNIVLSTLTATKDQTTSTPVASGQVFQIDGFGDKGKLMATTVIWLTAPKTTKVVYKLQTDYILNQPKSPMPNRVNALYDAYTEGAFSATSGLPVGFAQIDSPKAYGWLAAPKYSDVIKTLNSKGTLQTGGASNFGNLLSGKPVVKLQKSLPPSKYQNVLLADLIALKFSIAASALGVTPVGFGELIYDDHTSNPLNGMMVKDIATLGDSMMNAKSYSLRFRSKSEYDAAYGYNNLDSTVKKVNNAFEGAMDTVSFTVFKGTKPLSAIAYLHANPTIRPTIMYPSARPVPQMPLTYSLYQNYPNPFNPTTTIQFDLPEQAIVTLKVYNILGQEVGTLLDHQQMDDGTQEVQFNANSLASGVYFYRIVAQGVDDDGIYTTTFSTVKKMLLIK